MVYFRVKPQFDGAPIKSKGSLIANELLTQTEVKNYNVNINYLEKVTIPKSQVYFSFGARFQVGTDHNTRL